MTTLEVDGMERHKQENPFNYTEDQLAEKKLALHNMKIIYPDVNEFYAEMVYDMCKNTDEAKIELLKQKKILLVQGSAFNWPEPDHLRVVFLPHKEDLTKALHEFGNFLEDYRQ